MPLAAGRCCGRRCAIRPEHPNTVHPKAIAMFVAMLGEIGGIELLPDLLELAINPDSDILLHTNWAICRLGQRFPAEVLEEFRKRAADASLAVRCVIAEQLVLAPAEMDIPPVARALLNGFRLLARQGDAPYLLLTVAFAMELHQAGAGAPLILRCAEMLPRKSQEWLSREVETETSFVPRLAQHALDELEIEDVCIDRSLMDEEDDGDDDEQEDEDFEDDEDDEDDEDSDEEDEDEDLDDEEDEEEDEELDEAPQSVIAAPRPGRNDPCWCGSGKKYKKCHLAADELAARGTRQ